MPDGSAECGMILARLQAMEDFQQRKAAYFSRQLETINARLAAIELQKAAEAGESRALAKIGGWAVLILGGVGSAVVWFATGGGEDWIRKHLG